MLLSDAKQININNKEAKEIWFGGAKIWTPPSTVSFRDENTTGGFLKCNTWSDVQTILKEGKAQEVFSIGDKIGVKLINTYNHRTGYNNASVDYLIFGVNGFNLNGTSNTMNLTLTAFNNVFYDHYFDSDKYTDWEQSLIYAELNNNFINYLPAELSSIIVDTKYSYDKRTGSGSSGQSTVKTASKFYISSRYDKKPVIRTFSSTNKILSRDCGDDTDSVYTLDFNGEIQSNTYVVSNYEYLPLFNIG